MMENFYRLVLQGLEYIEPSDDQDYSTNIQPTSFESGVVDLSDPYAEQLEASHTRERSMRYSLRYRR